MCLKKSIEEDIDIALALIHNNQGFGVQKRSEQQQVYHIDIQFEVVQKSRQVRTLEHLPRNIGIRDNKPQFHLPASTERYAKAK